MNSIEEIALKVAEDQGCWSLESEEGRDDLVKFARRLVAALGAQEPVEKVLVDVGGGASVPMKVAGKYFIAPVPLIMLEGWINGAPAHPWRTEWFIAETTYGDRVVLMALPEDYSYDFKTADDTYIKADKIKRWMQFPDSSYRSPAPVLQSVPEGWQMVPKEPTEAMQIAGHAIRTRPNAYYGTDEIYAAMLAAAPSPQEEKP